MPTMSLIWSMRPPPGSDLINRVFSYTLSGEGSSWNGVECGSSSGFDCAEPKARSCISESGPAEKGTSIGFTLNYGVGVSIPSFYELLMNLDSRFCLYISYIAGLSGSI